MSLDMHEFEMEFPVVIPGYSAGYTEATLDPHWACEVTNPNCPTGEHIAQAAAHPVTEWLAIKADMIGAILITAVLVIVPGVLPIFI